MSNTKKSIGEVVAVSSAVAGAVLGAAAVLLSDKKNQEKLKNVIDDFSNEAVKFGKNVKDKSPFGTKAKPPVKKPEASVKSKKPTSKKTTEKIYTPKK